MKSITPKINLFVTIHSGTLALFTPYAYTDKTPERNESEM